MRAFPSLLGLAICPLLAFACGMDAQDGAATGLPNSGGKSNIGDAGAGGEAEPVPESLTFELVEDLAPRQGVMLRVRATPPGAYHVRFSLPSASDENAPLDAVLEATE